MHWGNFQINNTTMKNFHQLCAKPCKFHGDRFSFVQVYPDQIAIVTPHHISLVSTPELFGPELALDLPEQCVYVRAQDWPILWGSDSQLLFTLGEVVESKNPNETYATGTFSGTTKGVGFTVQAGKPDKPFNRQGWHVVLPSDDMEAVPTERIAFDFAYLGLIAKATGTGHIALEFLGAGSVGERCAKWQTIIAQPQVRGIIMPVKRKA